GPNHVPAPGPGTPRAAHRAGGLVPPAQPSQRADEEESDRGSGRGREAPDRDACGLSGDQGKGSTAQSHRGGSGANPAGDPQPSVSFGADRKVAGGQPGGAPVGTRAVFGL